MKLLVLGGTVFLGRHVVTAALARGHEVTLFNRARTNPQAFPEVKTLLGDRDGDLSALEGREWDAVVDTSGYVPRVVRASAELLADAIGHYTFVSSVSAYADVTRLGAHEDAPLATLEDESVEEVDWKTYGGLKVLCERAVAETFPGRALVLRPGLIVGPDDPTGRFTYWPHRSARGGDVLAPSPPDRPIQFIDVRDLAEWAVRLVEEGRAGVLNAVGPEPRPSMEELLRTCREVTGADAHAVWVDESFLQEQGVEEWIELPLWIHSEPGLYSVDVSRAVQAGLTFRPLEDTVRATLAGARPTDGAGLTPEREAELLGLWAERAAGTLSG